MPYQPISFSGVIPVAEHHVDLRRSVAKLVGGFGRKYYQDIVKRGEKATELWRALGDAGFLGAHIAEKWGGGGGGMTAAKMRL